MSLRWLSLEQLERRLSRGRRSGLPLPGHLDPPPTFEWTFSLVRSLLLIAAGGALGALMRHGVSAVVYRFVAPSFPWGTLAANLAGCFMIGALWAVSERVSFPPGLGVFLFTGMIGAFTTFSTYALESLQLMNRGDVPAGLANIAGSTLAGLFLVAVGMNAGRWILETLTATA